MLPDVQWTVERAGDAVEVDLEEADDVSDADTDAIIAATEELLTHEEVRVVRLNGPVLMQQGPPDGLGAAIRSLDALARRYGKRLIVGPM
jgi:hypothetical protein